jgi:prevent-host-death family protein
MRVVSVSELKAHLSRYLREVRRGGEVQVLDRGVPVARLVGLGAGELRDDGRRARLIRAGILRPGAGGAARLLRQRPLSLPGAELSAALDEERGDRA